VIGHHRDRVVEDDDLADPLIAFALLSSTLTNLPPTTGLAATVAIFIPGNWTSMPNCVDPFTSRRYRGAWPACRSA